MPYYEPLFHGWTPPEEKVCIRCGKKHMNQLTLTCDKCRRDKELMLALEDRKQDDIEHNWELLREGRKEVMSDDDEEDRQRERDRQDIISLGRYG